MNVEETKRGKVPELCLEENIKNFGQNRKPQKESCTSRAVCLIIKLYSDT
jgi:hypothetical protein